MVCKKAIHFFYDIHTVDRYSVVSSLSVLRCGVKDFSDGPLDSILNSILVLCNNRSNERTAFAWRSLE